MFIKYGYQTYPFWRIYCEDHAQLEVKRRLQFNRSARHSLVSKLTRSMTKHRSTVESMPAADAVPFDLVRPASRQCRVVLTLRKMEGGGFEVKRICTGEKETSIVVKGNRGRPVTEKKAIAKNRSKPHIKSKQKKKRVAVKVIKNGATKKPLKSSKKAT